MKTMGGIMGEWFWIIDLRWSFEIDKRGGLVMIFGNIFELMKKLENPTTFFFKQAENPPDLYRDEIE